MDLLIIFLSLAISQNILLTKFLGICPFLGVSGKIKSAFSMGMAVIFVIFSASVLSKVVYDNVLVPLEISFLRTVVFILVIASLVQFLEILIKKYLPQMYKSFGVYLPLITTNCAVLGTAFLVIDNGYTMSETMVAALGVSVGFTLVMVIFASLREKIESGPVPEGFKGIPIALVTATVMAILFSNGMPAVLGWLEAL